MAAQASWPGCGRIRCKRSSKGFCEDFVASTVSAPAITRIASTVQEESSDPIGELAHQNRELVDALITDHQASQLADMENA